jgi:hypothetical protein
MIQLQSSTGLIEKVPTGFSWTTLFFSFLVPLIRGQVGYAAIQAIIVLCSGGLAAFVFPFIINKHHIKKLLKKGYRPVGEMDRAYLLTNGFIPSEETHGLKKAA